MRYSTQALVPVIAIAAACGGSGPADHDKMPQPAGNQAFVLPSDGEILSKAYDNNYSVPDGFFVDERAETTRSYTVHHVLDDSNSFEMCSNDLVEAQALESEDNASRAVNGYYVTSYENERYFEFVRELAYTEDVGNVADPTSPGYGRVFKCNHTNRDGVDRNVLDGYSGSVNKERLGAETLRGFTEYLWQFEFFNTAARKVIASYTSRREPMLQHTLLLALVVNQGSDSCDRVDVVEWHFSADPGTGEIFRRFTPLHSFEATLAGGEPSFCD